MARTGQGMGFSRAGEGGAMRQRMGNRGVQAGGAAGGDAGAGRAGGNEARPVADDLLGWRAALGLGKPEGPDGGLSEPEARLVTRLRALPVAAAWSPETLIWFADLIWAGQVGHTILLPTTTDAFPTEPMPAKVRWLETSWAPRVLRDLESDDTHELVAGVLLALLPLSVGIGRRWPDADAVRTSPLFPIIHALEERGYALLSRGDRPTRLARERFAILAFACRMVATPLTPEFTELLLSSTDWFDDWEAPEFLPTPRDERIIAREQGVAVDRVYMAKAGEIHVPPERVEIGIGVMSIPRQTIALRARLPAHETNVQTVIDNILDIARPYLGPRGAQVIQALYEIANDPPNWRQPLITVETNALLDRVGFKRDARGIHYSRNRERLRDILNAAHALEVVGEYREIQGGRTVRRAIRQTVISLIGADFDGDESKELGTDQLFQRGLPIRMRIRLNFYEGVRRPDGQLGTHYVLMPRLGKPGEDHLSHTGSKAEMLKFAIVLHYRQRRTPDRSVHLTRAEALREAQITSRHTTKATQALTRALTQLVTTNFLEDFEPVPLPTAGDLSFRVTLTAAAASEIARI